MPLQKRTVTRAIALVVLLVLWYKGLADNWGPLLGVSCIVALFAGRIYCGWLCPAGAVLTWVRKLLPEPLLPRAAAFFRKPWVNVVLIVLFVVYMALLQGNWGLPSAFVFLIPYGLILGVLFGETACHRNCFFGTVFSLPSRVAPFRYRVQPETCIACGRCAKGCLNGAVVSDIEGHAVIKAHHCLHCGQCKKVCKQNSISFGRGAAK